MLFSFIMSLFATTTNYINYPRRLTSQFSHEKTFASLLFLDTRFFQLHLLYEPARPRGGCPTCITWRRPFALRNSRPTFAGGDRFKTSTHTINAIFSTWLQAAQPWRFGRHFHWRCFLLPWCSGPNDAPRANVCALSVLFIIMCPSYFMLKYVRVFRF